MAQVAARALPGAAGVLDLSPDGTVVAVVDARRGVCFRSLAAAPGPVCADLQLAGSAPISAAFSADGRWVALGQGVTARGSGLLWLVDPRTGVARPVPAVGGRPVARSSGARAAPSSPLTVGSSAQRSTNPTTGGPGTELAQNVSAYTGLAWSAAGDLLLISSSLDADGPRTRLVDLDPVSLVPRVVAEATGPYEFQSGYLATGGSAVLFTVYRGDQLLPNLVDVDLDSGVRREVGPIGPAGTRLVPLAVSPNGRVAVVGSAALTHPGPPRLLDIASGALTDIPGLSGDFGVAAFSPDGARVAVVCTQASGGLSLALAVVGTSPLAPARMVGSVPGPLPKDSRLTWSRFDVLSLTRPASTAAASILGWVLTG